MLGWLTKLDGRHSVTVKRPERKLDPRWASSLQDAFAVQDESCVGESLSSSSAKDAQASLIDYAHRLTLLQRRRMSLLSRIRSQTIGSLSGFVPAPATELSAGAGQARRLPAEALDEDDLEARRALETTLMACGIEDHNIYITQRQQDPLLLQGAELDLLSTPALSSCDSFDSSQGDLLSPKDLSSSRCATPFDDSSYSQLHESSKHTPLPNIPLVDPQISDKPPVPPRRRAVEVKSPSLDELPATAQTSESSMNGEDVPTQTSDSTLSQSQLVQADASKVKAEEDVQHDAGVTGSRILPKPLDTISKEQQDLPTSIHSLPSHNGSISANSSEESEDGAQTPTASIHEKDSTISEADSEVADSEVYQEAEEGQ